MSGGVWAELAVVRRSGVTESRHLGSLVALAADGSTAAALGDTESQVLPRSTLKPLQALGCLAAGAALTGPQLAIAGGSHTGQDLHVETVRGMLAAAGLDESALRCPPDLPEDPATRDRMIRDGEPPARVRMNCSGKHAAMLLACAARGWDTETYLAPEHPLQREILRTVERMTGEPVQHVAVDGCGAPVLSVSLPGLARAFRGLVTAEPGTPERAVADAMREHPLLVGGDGQVNSSAMALVPGLLAKGGAEGVIGMADAEGRAVALKVIDGNPRATTIVALTVLAALGAHVADAAPLMASEVLGGGRRVGSIQAGEDVLAWAAGR